MAVILFNIFLIYLACVSFNLLTGAMKLWFKPFDNEYWCISTPENLLICFITPPILCWFKLRNYHWLNGTPEPQN